MKVTFALVPGSVFFSSSCRFDSANVFLQVDELITKEWTSQVLSAEVAGVSDHPSLLSELAGHAYRGRKIYCHFPRSRDVSVEQEGLAEWQKAVEVKTGTDSQQHPSSKYSLDRSLCSMLHQHICLQTFYPSRLLTHAPFAAVSEPGKSSICWSHNTQTSLLLFLAAVPRLPVCLFLGLVQSLLNFLWDDCCLLNNLVPPQQAQSS